MTKRVMFMNTDRLFSKKTTPNQQSPAFSATRPVHILRLQINKSDSSLMFAFPRVSRPFACHCVGKRTYLNAFEINFKLKYLNTWRAKHLFLACTLVLFESCILWTSEACHMQFPFQERAMRTMVMASDPVQPLLFRNLKPMCLKQTWCLWPSELPKWTSILEIKCQLFWFPKFTLL